jgi:mannose-6-phosphate isomerase-like protein (cupin superfamily)
MVKINVKTEIKMKIFSLDETPYEPVSHDPHLKKKVLVKNILPTISTISHIILQPGNIVSEHIHYEFFEVFYCISGATIFSIKGERILIKDGHLLFVEPHEPHAISEVIRETELLYLHIPIESET